MNVQKFLKNPKVKCVQKRKTEENIKTFQCPCCGNDMENGFIKTPRYDMVFYKKRRPIFTAMFDKDAVTTLRGGAPIWQIARLCRNCNKILIDIT